MQQEGGLFEKANYITRIKDKRIQLKRFFNRYLTPAGKQELSKILGNDITEFLFGADFL